MAQKHSGKYLVTVETTLLDWIEAEIKNTEVIKLFQMNQFLDVFDAVIG